MKPTMLIRRIARDESLRCSGKHCPRWARWFLLFPSGAIRYYCNAHKTEIERLISHRAHGLSSRAQLARLNLTIRALELERRCLATEIAAYDLLRRSAAAQRSHRRYDAPDGSPVTRPAGARPVHTPPGRAPAHSQGPRSAPRLPASQRQPFPDTSTQHRLPSPRRRRGAGGEVP